MNKPVIVTGASGFVGAHLARFLSTQGHEVVAIGGTNNVPGSVTERCRLSGQANLAEPEACDAICSLVRPSTIVHAAAMANVSRCQSAPSQAELSNVRATANLLSSLQRHGDRSSAPLFVYISTDMVFDGAASAPANGFSETDAALPLSVYGSTKHSAEQAVLSASLDAVVMRTALVYGKKIEKLESFVEWVIRGLRAGSVSLFEDEFRTPVAVDDLAQAVGKLIDLPPGRRAELVKKPDKAAILHMSGPERISRVELGRKIAAALGLDANAIVSCSRASVPSVVPRPHDISLSAAKIFGVLGMKTRPIDDGLASIV